MRPDPKDNFDNRRENFRLKYDSSPTAVISVEHANGVEKSRDYNVIDISERGLRFRFDGGRVEDPVVGTVRLCNGSAIDVEGRIIRTSKSEVCLRLIKIIPARQILEEKKFLHRR